MIVSVASTCIRKESAVGSGVPGVEQGPEMAVKIRNVTSLQTAAALVYLGKMQEPSDLSRIARIIDKSPPGLKDSLIQVAGGNLREVTGCDSESLASRDLRMVVAKDRVLNGESIRKVAREHGLTYGPAILELEMLAVKGPARDRVLNGEPCYRAAREHGLTHGRAVFELEMIVVNGPAGERVRKGEPFGEIAREYGIMHGQAILELKRIADHSSRLVSK